MMRKARLLAWIALGACVSPPGDRAARTEAELGTPEDACRDVTVAWGHGAGQVGLDPAGPEKIARGPHAIAVTPSNEVLVLDAIGGKVLAVGARGELRVAAMGIAADADEIAVGSDGAFVVYSPLQARAWLFEPDGAPAGELAIDRSLRQVTGVTLGTSRRVIVRTAYQETFDAGSPAAPVALATMLAGKREGAFQLADGHGLATRAAAGSAALVVVSNDGRRSRTVATHPIPGAADAALLAGVAGEVACARVESVAQAGDSVRVERRAVCLDARTGRAVFDVALAAPGLYVPRQELTVGGTSPRLAMLHPTDAGLVVRTCEVGR